MTAEDFVVRESLAFEPSDDGEHLLLRLRKRDLTTPALARALADAFAVPSHAVGYAGMKDKRAVAEQWFSVATACGLDALPRMPGVDLLEARRHTRKLRRGEIAGNRFEIRLRSVQGDGWEAGLAALAGRGAPNYFGPQRFGGDNLQAATAWLPERRRRRVSRFQQGLYLSVVRSFLFNEVLGARVAASNWNQMLDGEAVQQTAAGDGPTGPLWGRGRSAAVGEAGAMESAALAPHAELLDGLEHAGLQQDRRALVMRASEMEWQRSGRDAVLRFVLPAGCFATSLLREVFELQSPETAQP